MPISAPFKAGSISKEMLPPNFRSFKGGSGTFTVQAQTPTYLSVNAGENLVKGDRIIINTSGNAIKTVQGCIGLVMENVSINGVAKILTNGLFTLDTDLFTGKIGLELFIANGVFQTKPFTDVANIHYLQSIGTILSANTINVDVKSMDYII